mmetsp:Transcript_60236/g.143572  ORF Transcript_60236/g.143572 Transcript_60236/m.143572 type:complete len:209 (+) Transcript_60236:910-1536(+)
MSWELLSGSSGKAFGPGPQEDSPHCRTACFESCCERRSSLRRPQTRTRSSLHSRSPVSAESGCRTRQHTFRSRRCHETEGIEWSQTVSSSHRWPRRTPDESSRSTMPHALSDFEPNSALHPGSIRASCTRHAFLSAEMTGPPTRSCHSEQHAPDSSREMWTNTLADLRAGFQQPARLHRRARWEWPSLPPKCLRTGAGILRCYSPVRR